MDITSLSMAMASNRLQTNVSVTMLDKTLDLSTTISDNFVAMIDAASMERSVNPSIGGNIDLYV
ncbi:MAG: YjfB family protein [Lachnospiraceae bacterium]|nr:YjfB family protein [Lachnospiraceae bacterium]